MRGSSFLLQVYLNGSEISSYLEGPTNETITNSNLPSPLHLGHTRLQFYMDELKVWYRELSAEQVLTTLEGGDYDNTAGFALHR